MKSPVMARTAVVAVLGLLGFGLSVQSAQAVNCNGPGFAPGYYCVINTDGIGVAYREAPYISAASGYGAPAGAQVAVYCFAWGDPVGPNNNRLWHLIYYAGRSFFVADRYLSTPTVTTNVPPPGEYGCQ